MLSSGAEAGPAPANPAPAPSISCSTASAIPGSGGEPGLGAFFRKILASLTDTIRHISDLGGEVPELKPESEIDVDSAAIISRLRRELQNATVENRRIVRESTTQLLDLRNHLDCLRGFIDCVEDANRQLLGILARLSSSNSGGMRNTSTGSRSSTPTPFQGVGSASTTSSLNSSNGPLLGGSASHSSAPDPMAILAALASADLDEMTVDDDDVREDGSGEDEDGTMNGATGINGETINPSASPADFTAAASRLRPGLGQSEVLASEALFTLSLGNPGDPPSQKKRALSQHEGNISRKRRRGKLPERATVALKRWLFEHWWHPYPAEEEKTALALQTCLSLSQINNWFTNARRRILPREKASSRGAPATPGSSQACATSAVQQAVSGSSSIPMVPALLSAKLEGASAAATVLSLAAPTLPACTSSSQASTSASSPSLLSSAPSGHLPQTSTSATSGSPPSHSPPPPPVVARNPDAPVVFTSTPSDTVPDLDYLSSPVALGPSPISSSSPMSTTFPVPNPAVGADTDADAGVLACLANESFLTSRSASLTACVTPVPELSP